MIKHPLSFRLESPLKEKNDEAMGRNERVVLYEGKKRMMVEDNGGKGGKRGRGKERKKRVQ